MRMSDTSLGFRVSLRWGSTCDDLRRAIDGVAGGAEQVGELFIPGHRVDEEVSAELSSFVNLHSLSLQGCDEVDNILEWVSILPNLRRLDITNSSVSDEGVKFLVNLENLEELFACGCYKITTIGFQYIAKLKSLQHLDLRQPTTDNITDDGFLHITTMVNLRVLCVQECREVSRDALMNVGRLVGLEHLCLRACDVTDEVVNVIIGLANLRVLDLAWIRSDVLTTNGLIQLSKCVNLEELKLERTGVTDEVLSFLALVPKLKSLNLSECYRVTNTGLAFLSGIDDVRYESKARDFCGIYRGSNGVWKFLECERLLWRKK